MLEFGLHWLENMTWWGDPNHYTMFHWVTLHRDLVKTGVYMQQWQLPMLVASVIAIGYQTVLKHTEWKQSFTRDWRHLANWESVQQSTLCSSSFNQPLKLPWYIRRVFRNPGFLWWTINCDWTLTYYLPSVQNSSQALDHMTWRSRKEYSGYEQSYGLVTWQDPQGSYKV